MSLVVTLRKFLSESIQPLTNSRDFDIKAAVRQVTGPDWRKLVNLVPKRVDLTTSDSPISILQYQSRHCGHQIQ
ncbi:predicted protein [Sclerotinia sclerotiorum 1980 UF-70]|uniref:Uncharacterized protein n=1 Tax=Sclerotinia sclerotiorum (strain ATCC 18683 / 1980 / Ss-1) TaxID=665079 RepID=A7EEK8_SCLS1|nr:predicted protein [Sclerotinia sclerotiorum 1980 UF-70]EDO01274.1 predicted protein [Sclerotinia sclerotiorum 1980 UF-70]